MSDFPQPPMPPGYGPIGYSGPQIYAPSPRPTVVTVLAIIGIIWGAWGILAGLYSVAFNAMALSSGSMPLSHAPLIMSRGMLEYSIVAALVHLALAVLLLAASIACLRLTKWGRRGMIWWGWAFIVLTIIGIAIAFINKDQMIQAAQNQMRASTNSNPAMTPQMRQQMQGLNNMQASIMSSIVYFSLFCPLLILIFPIWILATFNSPRVRGAFGEAAT